MGARLSKNTNKLVAGEEFEEGLMETRMKAGWKLKCKWQVNVCITLLDRR